MLIGISLPVPAADIYKWVDGEGVMHFSDEHPQDEGEFKRIRVDDSVRTDEISPKKREVPKSTKDVLTQEPAKDTRRVYSRSQQKLEKFPLLLQKHNWCVIASMEMIFR
jgi:negative regulator of sigma E activity